MHARWSVKCQGTGTGSSMLCSAFVQLLRLLHSAYMPALNAYISVIDACQVQSFAICTGVYAMTACVIQRLRQMDDSAPCP